MEPHSSTPAWKIPWMEEPCRLQSMGSLRVGHNWVTSLSLFTFLHWRRKWQPTPVFLPGESQGWRIPGTGEPGGLLSMRLPRVRHDWSNLAAAAAATNTHTWTSLVAQTVKHLPIMREIWVQSLGWKDLLEKEMATYSSVLAWKIPWMEETGRLQSIGSQRVGHNWATSLSLFTNT